jgi:hypothetical protein
MEDAQQANLFHSHGTPMARSPQWDAWISKARAVKIGEVVRKRGGLGLKAKPKGELVGPCPKCGGHDRFAVSTKKQVFNCRGCGAKGDVIALAMLLDHVDFAHACETLTGEPKPNGKQRTNGKAATAKTVVAEAYPYHDQDGELSFVVERVEYLRADGGHVLKDGKRKKTFRQKRPDPANPGQWLYNVDGVRIVPYRVRELLEAIALDHTIFIVEGERKVDALAAWNVAATCNAMGAGHWTSDHSTFLKNADVVLIPDADDAGFRHVHAVGATLSGIAERARVLMLPGLPPKGDVVDWIKAGGTREQFDALVADAPLWMPPPETDKPSDENAKADEQKAKAEAEEQGLIDKLSRLSGLEYDRRRNEAARDLGVRRGSIDREVEARRRQREEETGPAPLFGRWIVEPWPERVETNALLVQVQSRLKRHIVFSSKDQAVIVTLWTLFSWVHQHATHSPKLLITSPEPDSGKTTLCGLLSFLTPRALSCVEISEAVLFRSIERWTPTLIVDEADTLLVNNDGLRAVVNASWTRGAVVPRCIGDDHVPHAFPTFCPQVIGMKGKKLPNTTLTRCLVVELKRKLRDDCVEYFNGLDDAELRTLRQQALRWSLDRGDELKDAKPEMSEQFYNRLGDNYRMLFAIAELAGGDWLGEARAAAGRLSGVIDVTSRNVRLLAAIKEAFGTLEAISSASLVGALTADVTAEWTDWKGGKPITQTQLSRALGTFQIGPKQVRINTVQVRGYERAHFEDAWKRYLKPET